jgi:hypothetical protein
MTLLWVIFSIKTAVGGKFSINDWRRAGEIVCSNSAARLVTSAFCAEIRWYILRIRSVTIRTLVYPAVPQISQYV